MPVSRRCFLTTLGAGGAGLLVAPIIDWRGHEALLAFQGQAGQADRYPVPEWLAERNRESWKRTVRVYEEGWLYKPFLKDFEPVLRLVRGVEQSSLASSFHASPCVHALMVSIKERLNAAVDPFVEVWPGMSFRKMEASGRITMSYSRNTSDWPGSVEFVPEPEARACLERMLMRLRADSPGRGELS